jgi:hypothetical protein
MAKRHFQLYKAVTKQKGRNKFRATKCIIDGIKFDSIAEGDAYTYLKGRIEKGEIEGLIIHPKFLIALNGVKICNVILDFEYFDKIASKTRYIDVKGCVIRVSEIKRTLVQAQYGINVEWIHVERTKRWLYAL